MANYYQPEIETASPEQIRAWQDERLVAQVKHVWDNVPYYRKKMEEKGVTPDDVKALALPVLGHRIVLSGMYGRAAKIEEVIQEVLGAVPAPTESCERA